MTIAVITGGRDRTPTLFELEQLVKVIGRRGVIVVRHGDCRGTDKSAAAWIKARDLADVEPWPADWDRLGRAAGPKRNRAMLDGDGQSDLFGETKRPPVQLLIHFRGGDGTADCTAAAFERGLPVEWIADADEPRPWNRHHGEPPGPSIYVGEGSPLGNPWRDWRAELREGETRADAAGRVLDRYRTWLWSRIKPGPTRDPAVIEALEQLTTDHYVVCSCWPRHCHAEVIIKAWRWLRAQTLRQAERSAS